LDFVPPFGAPAFLGGALGMLAVLALSLAVPAWAVARTDPGGVLKQQGHSVVKAGRHWVLTGELALAAMLLVGSGLLLRSLVHLTRLPTGLQAPEQVLAGTVTLPAGAFPTPASRAAAFAALLARLQTLPGVTRTALTQTAPLYNAPGSGNSRTPAGEEVEYYRHWGAGDVPGALGLGLKAGRMPGPGEPGCALSANLAARLWPEGDPLGRTCPVGPWRFPVVGVLGAAAEIDPREGLDHQVWIPLNPDLDFVDVFLRGPGAPGALAPALRRAVREAIPGAQVQRTMPLSEVVEGVNEVPRKAVWLLGSLSMLALFLAGAGVYGVTAQWVLARRRELGVRLALGETPGGLVRLVLGQASRLALLGLGFGLLGSAWVGLALRHLLHGVGTLDPLSCAGGVATLAVGVLLAALVPALRAARTHPGEALRSE
jgi:putative ABC transport system permease protein